MRPRAGFEPALKRHRGGTDRALPRFRTPSARKSRPPRPATITDFAIALRAPKPEKPCDKGVFGAFYLLLFLQ